MEYFYKTVVCTYLHSINFCKCCTMKTKIYTFLLVNLFFTFSFSQVFTYLDGSKTTYGYGYYGVYGTMGSNDSVPQQPSCRYLANSWLDPVSGNVFLYGGVGYLEGSTASLNDLNDMWCYNTVRNKWSYLSGTKNLVDLNAASGPFAGATDIFSNSYSPGSKKGSFCWTGSDGYLWMFGGGTYYNNDIWKFNPSTKQWAWVAGTKTVSPTPVYGTQGTAAATNFPAPFIGGCGWIDNANNLWIYSGDLKNDLWKYNPTTKMWTWVQGNHSSTPVYGTIGVAASTNTPGQREGSCCWYDGGDNLYLFGGGGSVEYRNDVWKYTISTNQWTWIKGTNGAYAGTSSYGTKNVEASTNIPDGRKFAGHWKGNDGNFYFYAGNDRQVPDDFWKYNPTTNNFTWIGGTNGFHPSTTSCIGFYGVGGTYGTKGVEAATNTPGGDRNKSNIIKLSNGNIWMFGGIGTGDFQFTCATYNSYIRRYLNDVWTYNFNNNYWTWQHGKPVVDGMPIYGTVGSFNDVLPYPGARANAATWIDNTGNLWLYGGTVKEQIAPSFTSSNTNYLSDLWKCDKTTGRWTWMKGMQGHYYYNYYPTYGTVGVENVNNIPGHRDGTMSWKDSNGFFWLFGGQVGTGALYNDLWRYNTTTNSWMVVKTFGTKNYGIKGIEASTNMPVARTKAAYWVDASNNLYMYGGYGSPTGTNAFYGYLNDLWKYNPTTNNWTWLSGDSTQNQQPNFGTQGVEASTNTPGNRTNMQFWKGNDGNFYLFSGISADYGTQYYYNDVWKYNPNTNNWTWLKGSSSSATNGANFGSINVESNTNTPTCIQNAICFKDNTGNLYLYGGTVRSYQNNSHYGRMDDLWKYNPTTNNWTFLKGNTDNAWVSQTPDYGTQGVPSVTNNPSGRELSNVWDFGNGNIYFLGGWLYNSSVTQIAYMRNDLWSLNLNSTVPLNNILLQATKTNGKNILQWQTQLSNKIQEFIIEAKTDADFKTITTVKFNSINTKYIFTDIANYTKNVYYRVKVQDIDGKITYSNTVYIKLIDEGSLVAYPNPVQNNLYVTTHLVEKISLFDMNGKELWSNASTTGIYQINTEKLTSGVYILVGYKHDGTIIKEKIIKQ